MGLVRVGQSHNTQARTYTCFEEPPHPHPYLAARAGPVVVDELPRQVLPVAWVLRRELQHGREEDGAHLGHGHLRALFGVCGWVMCGLVLSVDWYVVCVDKQAHTPHDTTHTQPRLSTRVPYRLLGHELEAAEDDAVAARQEPRVALDLLVHLTHNLGFGVGSGWVWWEGLLSPSARLSTEGPTHIVHRHTHEPTTQARTHHVADPVELAGDGPLDVGAEQGRGGADHLDDVAGREEPAEGAVCGVWWWW